MEKLKQFLSQRADIEVIKDGHVFTLLMRGKNLTNGFTVMEIQQAVFNTVGEQYPVIEVFKNDKDFLLMVLKQQDQNL